MATQAQVQNTLLAATIKVANLVNNNLTTLTGGGLTVEWGYINLVQRAINCVQRQYNLQDYVSAPFILAYDRLLLFVGTYGAGNINPNAQNPSTNINVVETINTAVTVQVPFSNATGYTINWQSDIPLGYGQTYAQLLGNYFPNPVVYFNGAGYVDSGSVPTVTYTGGLIQTVVFDWGQSQSGFIRF